MRVVVVCGSRYKDALPETITEAAGVVHRFVESLDDDVTVVTGGASGVDTWAHRAAKRRGLEAEVIRARWRVNGVYNPRAGFERNRVMLDRNPSLVIAVWDGSSTGTKDTIDEAKRRNIPIQIQVVK